MLDEVQENQLHKDNEMRISPSRRAFFLRTHPDAIYTQFRWLAPCRFRPGFTERLALSLRFSPGDDSYSGEEKLASPPVVVKSRDEYSRYDEPECVRVSVPVLLGPSLGYPSGYEIMGITVSHCNVQFDDIGFRSSKTVTVSLRISIYSSVRQRKTRGENNYDFCAAPGLELRAQKFGRARGYHVRRMHNIA